MQRNIKSLIGYSIRANDGQIGKVEEFYFDDENWIVRYLVVKTGGWLFGRKVLISPQSVQKIAWDNKDLLINLTKEQVQKSPDIDTDKPLSRQQEIELYGHYTWQRYGGNGFYAGGVGAVLPELPVLDEGITPNDYNSDKQREYDLHLRSTNIITGYHIHAIDGEIGHVNDFIIDDETWKVLYLVIDTSNFIGGEKILISVINIQEIQWLQSKVMVNMTKASINECISFDELKYDHSESANHLNAKI